jgi:hypothetical protein
MLAFLPNVTTILVAAVATIPKLTLRSLEKTLDVDGFATTKTLTGFACDPILTDVYVPAL